MFTGDLILRFPILTKEPNDLRHTSNLIHSTYYCTPHNQETATVGKGRMYANDISMIALLSLLICRNITIAQSTQTQKQVVENAIDALARVLSKTTWDNIECLGVSVRDVDCPPFIFYRCPGLERILKEVHVAKGEKIPAFSTDFRKLSNNKDVPIEQEPEEVIAEPKKKVVKESKPQKRTSKQEVIPNAPKEEFKQPKKILRDKKSARK